ncbi:MAG: leucine-rich repeat domain-containing protein [Alistipes sp.]|nr:leucine-rich repeat domain-containing protein [Alistipes sp.]
MKRLYILLSATALMLGGCQRDIEPVIEGFESDSSTIEAKATGGEHLITIRSDKAWSVQTDAPWLMISPANGRGEVECRVKIDSTLINDPRSATINFTSAGQLLSKIDVKQEGFEHSISPDKQEIVIDASAIRANRWVEVEIVANVEFDVVSDAEWLTIGDYKLNLDCGARPRSTRLHIDWKMNSDPTPRETTLVLTPKGGQTLSAPASIKIRQAAGPLIEDCRQGDSLAIVTIYNKMECWVEGTISSSEPMHRWESVRLWESTDRNLPCPEAVGRVRDLDLSFFSTDDDIPSEIKHLKYLETLSLYGNINSTTKSIKLCEEVATLDYLKDLRIGAMGLVSLPSNFAELGDTLETLDLNSNNLTSIPEVINAENFPHLKSLDLSSNRRTALSSLTNVNNAGIYVNMREKEDIRRLLLWENLEELTLSYNYIEGTLPDFNPGEEGVRAYSKEDVVNRGDTLNWAVENNLPRILPNARKLSINLNFMTGTLPDWLLYHPRLLEWGPEVLVYPQQEKGFDSEGKAVGFDNVPTSTEYYFEAYPLYRSRYEFNDETN